jgi:hypothetical protein
MARPQGMLRVAVVPHVSGKMSRAVRRTPVVTTFSIPCSVSTRVPRELGKFCRAQSTKSGLS